jgi:exonuclease III
MLNDTNCTILNWNARGLNNPARCQVVKDLIMRNKCSVVYIQETKLQSVTRTTIQATLGQDFVDHLVVLPTIGTRGGIILACSQQYYELLHVYVRQFSVTV